jgi:hypothetical protein
MDTDQMIWSFGHGEARICFGGPPAEGIETMVFESVSRAYTKVPSRDHVSGTVISSQILQPGKTPM